MGPIRPATPQAYTKLAGLIAAFEDKQTPGNYTAILNCFIEECGGTSKVCKELGLHYGSLNKARQTGSHKVDPASQELNAACIKRWVTSHLPATSAKVAKAQYN